MKKIAWFLAIGLLGAVVVLFIRTQKSQPEQSTSELTPVSPVNTPVPVPVKEIPRKELSESLRSILGVYVVPHRLQTIPELRLHAKPGDQVIFEAKVMGALEPFSPDRASVMVGDENTVASCDLLGIDELCETPWDAHHEELSAVKAGTAYIQIVDRDGHVEATGLRGAAGIKELSRLRIAGVIAPESSDDALVVNATAVQILP